MPFEPRFETLVQIYAHSMASYGSRDLFGTKTNGRWVWTTYSEFGAQVDRLRGALAALGVERNDCVAIIANNRVEWAVVAYACCGLGAPFVPMYEAQDPRDWDYIVRDCEAKVLFVADEKVLAKAKVLLDTAASLESVVVLGSPSSPPVGALPPATNGSPEKHPRVVTYASLLGSGKATAVVAVVPSDTAALLYTSGTTGNPKGVVLTHLNLASNVSGTLELFPSLTSDDRSLSFLPWAHAFGQTGELHTLLARGASIALCEGVDKILDNLREVQPTVLFSVPRIFNKLYTAVQQQLAARPKPVRRLVRHALALSEKGRNGSLSLHERLVLKLVDALVFKKVRARLGGRLRYSVAGGAALSRDVAQFLDSLGIVVFEGYGLTETSPVASVNAPGAHKAGSVGRAIPGVRIAIDPAAAEQKAAEGTKPDRLEGEVLVYGLNVMKGYFKHPEETAAALREDGGLRTGDMGYLDAEGFLFITGRIKEQYKLENGKYVVPTPLEEQLKLSPYVLNAMVYGENRPFNVALVVANVPAVRKWAAESHVALPEDGNALLSAERVRSLFESEIEKYQSGFKSFEWIREFALTGSDFTTDNGMLTPSLKLKRRAVVETYRATIDALYANRGGHRARATTTAA